MNKSLNRRDRLMAGVKQEESSMDRRYRLADQILVGCVSPQDQEGVAVPGVIFKVPLDQLRDNPYNARRIYLPEEIASRAASLKADGQRSPIEVAPDPENPGAYIHITGHYRKYAAQQLGWPSLDAVLREVSSPRELYRLSFIENKERADHCALDDALAWKALLNDGIVEKEEDLVTMTGFSWSKVNKTLSLLKLPESVQSVMRSMGSFIGTTMGYEIHLYHEVAGEDLTLELLSRLKTEDMSYRQVEELRKCFVAAQSAQPKSRKKKEVFRPYKIRIDGQVAGVLKESDDTGKVELSIVMNNAQERQEFMLLLKKRFGLDAE